MNAEERERTLSFAREHVAQPWRTMVETAKRISQGQELGPEEARIRLPMTPFTADARVLYPLMRDIVGLLTWDPNNLFTIILEDDGQHVYRAFFELTRDNNFIEMIEVPPDDPMLALVLEFIAQDRIGDLRWMLDETCQLRFGKRINWVKIAKLSFFHLLGEAWRVWEQTGDIWAWGRATFQAVQKIYAEKLLMFGHEPPVFARLREIITNILDVDPRHIDFARLFGPLPKKTEQPQVIALAGRDYLVALKLGGSDPLHLTVDREATRVHETLPMKKIARRLRKDLNAGQVIVLRTEPLANLCYEATRPPLPWQREDLKLVLQRVLEIVKGFGATWHMHPLPFYLKDWFRLPGKLLGLPYDINRLAAWFMPKVIIDGMEIFLGQYNNRTFILLDGDEPVLVLNLEMYNAGPRRLRTFDPMQFKEVFAKPERSFQNTRFGVEEVGLRLWDQGFGFQNMMIGMRLSAMKALGDLLAVRHYSYLYRMFGAIRPLIRVVKEMKAGGLAVYPDRLLVSLEHWVREVGRPRIWGTLLNMMFDRKPRPRGLLYVKGTIFAALAVVLVIGLLVYGC